MIEDISIKGGNLNSLRHDLVSEAAVENIELVDVSEFLEDRELFSDAELLIQLKGFNRFERLNRQTRQIMTGVAGSSESRPISTGAVYILDTLGDATSLEEVPHPHEYSTQDSRGVAFYDKKIFLGCTDHIEVIDRSSWKIRPLQIESDWLGFVHSLAISPDGVHMAIVSSGFDRIVEVEISTGKVSREWIAWDNGFNVSKKDGSIISSKNDPNAQTAQQGRNVVVVQSPKDYPGGLGLPPGLRTAFPNSTQYLDKDTLLTTFFHYGLVKIDLKSGKTTVLDNKLTHPHSVYKIDSGFMVTNTGKGQAIFYDKEFNRKKVLDFSTMRGLTEEAQGRQWLQHVNPLSDGRYIAVDSNRASLIFVDENQRKFRSVAFPRNWVVQEAHILDH